MRAIHDLRRAPRHVAVKLQSWVDLIEQSGLEYTRRIPGYHDEPLKGKRTGQRSIRLSRSYRAIYYHEESNQGAMIIVSEVHKHDY